MGIAVGILCLQTAFGIEPPLYAGYIIILFVILCFVLIEVVVGCYNVKLREYMYGGGCIVSVTLYVSVLTGEVFSTQTDRLCLDSSACRPAVTCVAIACGYIRIDGRCGNCTSLTFDERTTH